MGAERLRGLISKALHGLRVYCWVGDVMNFPAGLLHA